MNFEKKFTVYKLQSIGYNDEQAYMPIKSFDSIKEVNENVAEYIPEKWEKGVMGKVQISDMSDDMRVFLTDHINTSYSNNGRGECQYLYLDNIRIIEEWLPCEAIKN